MAYLLGLDLAFVVDVDVQMALHDFLGVEIGSAVSDDENPDGSGVGVGGNFFCHEKRVVEIRTTDRQKREMYK